MFIHDNSEKQIFILWYQWSIEEFTVLMCCCNILILNVVSFIFHQIVNTGVDSVPHLFLNLLFFCRKLLNIIVQGNLEIG